ncbi:MAG TPA: MauE/DoxX family redox-associated membrane protein [Thermoanaerobaculia bacterium]|nr:MauE/DoxX family redox-associated membrane protein [Thermoanaerobaculia bacterium]
MQLRSWLLGPWLTVRVQIALGALFVAAALPKIVDPPAFAQMIYNYRIVPGFAVNAAALVMPWLELLAGLALILGIWRRSAASIVGALLLVFIVALGINLARDHAVNCGCFDVSGATKNREQLLDEMRWVVVRDLAMLLMVAQILVATGTPRETSA